MPIIKPVFSEGGALIAYGNSEGLLQYVASDRYNALRKKIIAENNQKDEAQRALARKEQSERESGPSP